MPFGDSVCLLGHIGRAEVKEVEKDMLSSLNEKNERFSSRRQQIDLAATVHYQSSQIFVTCTLVMTPWWWR